MATNETSESSPSEPASAAPSVGVVKDEAETEARPSSPDPACPICLDNVTDVAYTDMCLHRFCFQCLVTWSRVKPECPLCKKRFSLIIHNVRSWADYDQLPVAWPEPSPALDANFFISVAFQRPRFRYRTTGGSWSCRLTEPGSGPSTHSGNNHLLPSSSLSVPYQANPLASSTTVNTALSAPSTTCPLPPPVTYVGNSVASDWCRRRQVSAVEFRRNIYRQNQWVCPAIPRPGSPLRVRECTPAFYRNNPAQVHRLMPWLYRELLVLLDVRYDYQEVCQMICHAITNMSIRDSWFQAMLRPYFHERTAHFCHEFYHFASSPYDILAYDLRAMYVRRDQNHTEPSSPITQENNSDSSDIELIETREDPIEISDDEPAGVEIVGEDSDTSVEIISTLPPLSERELETIDLLDSDSDINLEPIGTSTAIGAISSPTRASSSESKKERVGERLRNKNLPSYKDESSSSEEEVPRRKQLRKRKRKCSKPLKKRKIIFDYSSSDCENSHQSTQDSNYSHSETKPVGSKIKPSNSSPPHKKRSSSKSSSSNSTESSRRSKSDSSKRISFQLNSPAREKCRTKNRNDNFHLPPPIIQVKKCSPHHSPIESPFETYFPELVPRPNHQPVLLQWSKPLGSDSDVMMEDQNINDVNSLSRTPSPKPQLKSVVKKITPKDEAGCSSWHSHNLRQRKCTIYAPYFSTSDSDS